MDGYNEQELPTPDNEFQNKAPGKPIPYEELDLGARTGNV
jgi:hypothetical protein